MVEANKNVVPLPKTKAELLNGLELTSKTLNDYVQEIVLAIWEEPEFQKFIDAVDDSDAAEGTLDADDHEAAKLIREHAKTHAITVVEGKKIHTLMLSMRVVLKRLKQGRKQRAAMVGGVVDLDTDDPV